MLLTMNQIEEFKKVVRPVMNYLGDPKLFHPHVKIIIDSGRAEIVEGIATLVTDDYISDQIDGGTGVCATEHKPFRGL